jgi:hypothetical protein
VLDARVGSKDSRLSGAYRGPLGLGRSVEHHRDLRAAGGGWQFRDEVLAAGDHLAILRLHLAPNVLVRCDGKAVTLLAEAGQILGWLHGEGLDWRETRSPYHPSFGVEIERACVMASLPFRHRLEVDWSIELT